MLTLKKGIYGNPSNSIYENQMVIAVFHRNALKMFEMEHT